MGVSVFGEGSGCGGRCVCLCVSSLLVVVVVEEGVCASSGGTRCGKGGRKNI